MAKFTVALDYGGCARLKVSTDGFIGFGQQGGGLGTFDELNMALQREWIPMQEVTAAGGAVEGDLVSAENQAGESIARVAYSGQVAPGASGVTSVDTDAVAMDAPDRFAGRFTTGRATHVSQDQLISGQGYGFTDCCR